MQSFAVKFFKALYFPNHMMHLVYIWYDGRYRSEVFYSNNLNHPNDQLIFFPDHNV